MKIVATTRKTISCSQTVKVPAYASTNAKGNIPITVAKKYILLFIFEKSPIAYDKISTGMTILRKTIVQNMCSFENRYSNLVSFSMEISFSASGLPKRRAR